MGASGAEVGGEGGRIFDVFEHGHVDLRVRLQVGAAGKVKSEEGDEEDAGGAEGRAQHEAGMVMERGFCLTAGAPRGVRD